MGKKAQRARRTAQRKGKNTPAQQQPQQQQPQQPQPQEEAVGDVEAQQAAELAELDDWGTAWEEAKRTGLKWGGQGRGGRAIHRWTWQPEDVLVEGVSMAYEGKELLTRTRLKLPARHRYGLLCNTQTALV